ncbi:hypothetical protein [Sinorhizobium meliloti]|uniref:hypothetical protein n=1 Tax=Rhizobium meliloti TaxID=382 RepID=UPI00299DC412|nr:hypothetical protein [Sinorhizobium meliloti]MDW9836700.1 hypothetical protein [Sinorhizobium meliloti]MDX0041059.1 hypothetical protein [Sinorhizobium meliloti]MDX0090260.1 hypothetical protein [Sinorhizobium meliloti]
MADINQWQLPRNEANKLLGWSNDGRGMVNKDPAGFATADQGAKADTAMQPAVYDPDGKNAAIFARLPVMPEAFGAQYDGSDDKEAIEDAAAFAVAQKRPLFLSPGRTYTVSSLVLAAGLAVMGSGALRHDGTTAIGDVVSVGANSKIENLIYSTPAHGNGIYDVRVGEGSHIGYLETIADAQSQGVTVATTGQDVWLGFHKAVNCDRPFHLDNTAGGDLTSGFYCGGADYTSYMRGIRVDAARGGYFGPLKMTGRSPNAINEAPGYNSVLLTSAQGWTFAGGTLEDSGEHCIRVGGNTGPGLVNTTDISFGPLIVKRCSASAVKLNANYQNRTRRIHFESVIGVDVGYTTGVTAKRSDGLRLSHCEDITFGTVDFVVDQLATSSEVALRLNNAKNIVIEHLGARFVESGILAIDETADVDSGQGATQSGDVTSIHIKSLVGAKGAGTYPFSFDLPNHDMGDIRIHGMDVTGLTTGLAAFGATTNLTDVLEFQGRVVTSSTAAVSNPPASDDFRFDLRINGAHYLGPYRKVTANTATETIGADPFDPGAAPTQLGALYLQSQTGTAAQGNWGSGLVYSRAGASGRRGVATASKQTGASAHQMGFSVLVNGGTASSEVLAEALQVTHEKALAIPDGITAPTTVSGWAQIFVDAVDGDLKVKFGDGTVKTVVVDT